MKQEHVQIRKTFFYLQGLGAGSFCLEDKNVLYNVLLVSAVPQGESAFIHISRPSGASRQPSPHPALLGHHR